MSSEEIVANCDLKMKKAFEVFTQEMGSLRTGRANASMLDIIKKIDSKNKIIVKKFVRFKVGEGV